MNREKGRGKKGTRKERYVQLIHVLQSVPGRLTENSGHIGPCEAF